MSGKYELTTYGKMVQKHLIDKNMTQKELAEQLGCTRQYLNNVLHGVRSGTKYREMIEQILGIENVA